MQNEKSRSHKATSSFKGIPLLTSVLCLLYSAFHDTSPGGSEFILSSESKGKSLSRTGPGSVWNLGAGWGAVQPACGTRRRHKAMGEAKRNPGQLRFRFKIC